MEEKGELERFKRTHGAKESTSFLYKPSTSLNTGLFHALRAASQPATSRTAVLQAASCRSLVIAGIPRRYSCINCRSAVGRVMQVPAETRDAKPPPNDIFFSARRFLVLAVPM